MPPGARVPAAPPGAGPGASATPTALRDSVTISDAASSRLWLSGSVAAVRQLAGAVRELEQAAPLTGLVPLAGRLATAASDVGARFAAAPPAPAPGDNGSTPGLAVIRPGAPAGYAPPMPGRSSLDASPPGIAVAAPDAPAGAVPGRRSPPAAAAILAERPVAQPGALAGYARFTPAQPPVAPLAAPFPPLENAGTAPGAPAGAAVPAGRIPPATPPPSGQPATSGPPTSHAPIRSSTTFLDAASPPGIAVIPLDGRAPLAASPRLTPLRDGSRLNAPDVAPSVAQRPEDGVTPAVAGEAARALLVQAADALAVARLRAEQAPGPELAGAALAAPAPQDVAAALAHAQRHVGLATLQLAAFGASLTGPVASRASRAGELRASGLLGLGWTLGDIPQAMSRTRRALVAVLLCATGAAAWGMTTLDLTAARLACALALGALGLAGIIRLRRRTRLRVRLAGAGGGT